MSTSLDTTSSGNTDKATRIVLANHRARGEFILKVLKGNYRVSLQCGHSIRGRLFEMILGFSNGPQEMKHLIVLFDTACVV